MQDSDGIVGTVGRDEIRKFTKFKVEIDLHKLIVSGWTLDLGSDTPVRIEFKYERLPNICFSCGRFDHETRLCPYATLVKASSAINSKFGLWLRAEHSAMERIMKKKSSPPSESGQREFNPEEMEDATVVMLKSRDCSIKPSVTGFTKNQERMQPIDIQSVGCVPKILQKNVTVSLACNYWKP